MVRSKKLLCPFSSGAVTASYCDGDKCKLWRVYRGNGIVICDCVFNVEYELKLRGIIK